MTRVLTLLALALVCLLGGCRACGGTAGVVATLAQRQGSANREASRTPGSWAEALPGTTFSLGDAVRTLGGSRAKVELASGGALQLGENTTIRFLVPGATSRRVGVETGEAEIETGTTGLSIQTTVGLARLEPGSHVHITSVDRDMRFDVLLGRAQFDADEEGGPGRALEAGQRFVVTTGKATLEAIEPPAKGALDAGRSDAAPPDAAAEAASPEGVQAEVHGAGVRTAPSADGGLTSLPPGTARLAEGARLVVPEGASVDITRGEEHVTLAGRADAAIGKAGATLLRLQSGRVLLTSPTVGMRIDVPGGSIVLAASGPGNVQGEIEVEHQGARVTSNQGQLQLRGKTGVTLVGAGQSGTLDAHGVATTDEIAPSVADVTIEAGESPVMHSPRGAVAVRVRFDACPADAIVQLASRTSTRRMFARGQGTSTAVLPLVAGAYKYAVRCVGSAGSGTERGGTLRVLRDSGAARLPRMAPVNVIDADGRHYSILYQNLLPQMSFRWPGAPAAGAVSLHLERASGVVQKLSATAGTVTLPSGAVREGSYKFWFEADGTSNRSPDTTVQISFDNAAPAAEIQQPVDGQPSAATVHVSGVAAEGSTVTVSGTTVPMDPEARFVGDVPGPPAGDRSIAIRIAHPVHGIHYYLRMFRAPSP